MWWGKNSDNKDTKVSPTSTAGAETSTDPRYDKSKTNNTTSAPAAFDPNKLPARQKLSPALQKIVDKQERDENYFDELYDG